MDRLIDLLLCQNLLVWEKSQTNLGTQAIIDNIIYKEIQSNLSMRTPLYYGQFPMYRQNSHTFLLKKTSIIRTLSNTDNGHLISAPGGNFIQT